MDLTKTAHKPGTVTIAIARACGALAVLALLGAWITQLTGGTILGMGQQHFFEDATVLTLFCIAGLLDGILHSKGIGSTVS